MFVRCNKEKRIKIQNEWLEQLAAEGGVHDSTPADVVCFILISAFSTVALLATNVQVQKLESKYIVVTFHLL